MLMHPLFLFLQRQELHPGATVASEACSCKRRSRQRMHHERSEKKADCQSPALPGPRGERKGKGAPRAANPSLRLQIHQKVIIFGLKFIPEYDRE